MNNLFQSTTLEKDGLSGRALQVCIRRFSGSRSLLRWGKSWTSASAPGLNSAAAKVTQTIEPAM
jgi:hypothetical protein